MLHKVQKIRETCPQQLTNMAFNRDKWYACIGEWGGRAHKTPTGLQSTLDMCYPDKY